MSSFVPSAAYHPDLDIRLGAHGPPPWAQRLVSAREPNAACWLVVMPRRAGKSWLASGIVNARPAGTTTRIDLRDRRAVIERAGLQCLLGVTHTPELDAKLLIIDEPGFGEGDSHRIDPRLVAIGLKALRSAGVVPVVFATPLEHSLLVRELGADAPKDILRPPALNMVEVGRMTARQSDWAPDVARAVGAVDPSWLQTPFLLEVVLQVAEEHPSLRGDVPALLTAAVDAANVGHQYLDQLFHNGLAAKQRADLRGSRWRDAGIEIPELGALQLLTETRVRGDPVLTDHLPEVLRVHHITDLHHGGPMRPNVVAKDRSRAGHNIALLAGAGSPLDSYLGHVRQLRKEGRAPHLVIVTGDLVNRPSTDFGEQALAWLAALEATLAPHSDLGDGEPRIVLTGGNHDVAWDLCLNPHSEARHAWFADTFARYPHPQLNEPMWDERRVFVKYARAGLRIALLGSAESGGEVARDEDRALIAEHRDSFTAADEEEAISDLVTSFERLDPGVVAHAILDRLAPEAGYVTVAAIHHPLSPVPAVEVAPYTGIVNAGQVKQALAHANTALVLHGHTHLGFLAAERLLGPTPGWTLRIAGAAALASAASREQNGYNEIFLAREGDNHSVVVRHVRFDGGRWEADRGIGFRPGEPAELNYDELVADAATRSRG
jgi:hypothetical protein